MGLFVLVIAFWLPFVFTMLLGASWLIALIVGSVACGSMFAYLLIKSHISYKKEDEIKDMTAMERANMAM